MICCLFILSKCGIEVIYVIGNYDEFLCCYLSLIFGNICLVDEVVYSIVDGCKLLVIYGD